MTQKSLIYMVIAIAVGYILVSAVPQQVAMYSTPPLINHRGDGELAAESIPESGTDTDTGYEDQPSDSHVLSGTDKNKEISFIEMSRLPELMKWWTFDILVALTIYWVAKQRLG